MNEFLKSFSSLSLALALLPLKQVENVFTPSNRRDGDGPAIQAMDSITNAVLDQFGGTLKATFSALDNVQRGIVALSFPSLSRRRSYGENKDFSRHVPGLEIPLTNRPATGDAISPPFVKTGSATRRTPSSVAHGREAVSGRKR